MLARSAMRKTLVGRAAKRAVKRMTGVIQAPLESEIQAQVFEYLNLIRLPSGLTLGDYSFAVPNGSMLAGDAGQRARMINAMKKQGLKVGVPDVVIAYPMHGSHGAYLELKRAKNSPISDEQQRWCVRLACAGYCTYIAVGFDEAKSFIDKYMDKTRV